MKGKFYLIMKTHFKMDYIAKTIETELGISTYILFNFKQSYAGN